MPTPTPTLLSIVDGIPSPAMVLGPSWDIVAANLASSATLDLDYAPSRNFLRLTFTPQARHFNPNWAGVARQRVALFRAHSAGRFGHPAIQQLVSELGQQSAQFREWWAEQEVSDEMHSGHLTFDHPFVGHLSFDFELFDVLESPSLMLHVFVCSGAGTHERLEELVRQKRSGEHTPTHNFWTVTRSNGWAPREV
jgi:hypothetical protein